MSSGVMYRLRPLDVRGGLPNMVLDAQVMGYERQLGTLQDSGEIEWLDDDCRLHHEKNLEVRPYCVCVGVHSDTAV
jgi:hypothetical protein